MRQVRPSPPEDTPSDGVITGYGVIHGSLAYVYAQDVSAMNGTMGEMHARKITRIYDLAMKIGAPVIGLVDCAGLRLQEGRTLISSRMLSKSSASLPQTKSAAPFPAM